jgi:lambda family phage portal protein
MNFLDNAIAWIAPAAGARRIAYRRAIDQHRRGFDASRRDQRTQTWVTPGSSANAEVAQAEEVMRARSRDLVRNNGFAAQIVETVADHVVGTGIMGAPTGLRGRNQTRVAQAWSDWCGECDWDGDNDLFGLQWLAAKAMEESGAVLIRFRRLQFDARTSVAPLQLQLLEPDFIDVMKNGGLANGGLIDRGIEYDSDGRVVAYWLYDHHPGDVAQYRRFSLASTRIPAAELIYLYTKLRPGQDRGVPLLAPAVMTLKDLDAYFEAERVRKRIEACLAGFITTEEADGLPLSPRDPNETSRDGRPVDRFVPGMLTRLKPGEDIKITQPSNSQPVGEMATWQLREAAAAAGVMYEHATGDFRNVNYSSWRAGHHGFRRRMERKQWHVMIHKACRPIGLRFREAYLAAGLSPVATFGMRHTPPGFISVDPYKDAQADLANLRMGQTTLSQLVEERGYDYLEFLDQVAADLAAADEALGTGVMFDGDPRKIVAGAAKSKDKSKKDKADASAD